MQPRPGMNTHIEPFKAKKNETKGNGMNKCWLPTKKIHEVEVKLLS